MNVRNTDGAAQSDRPRDLGQILIIIPTYNEVENIEQIVTRIRGSVPAAHVLIADDNSPEDRKSVV